MKLDKVNCADSAFIIFESIEPGDSGGHQWVTKWSVDSGCHKLSENIWFAWSNTCYRGKMSRLWTDRQTDRHTDM